VLGGAHHGLEFFSGRLGRVHVALAERGEAAVRIEEDLLRREVLKRLVHPLDDLYRVFHLVRARIGDAEADLLPVTVVFEDLHGAGARRGELEHELLNVHGHQAGHQ